MKSRALPSTASIVSKYNELGSVKSTALHYRVTQSRVSTALHSVGAIKRHQRVIIEQGSKDYCQCDDCINATAPKCVFMRAESDKAEDVLIEWGCRYKSRTTYTTTGIYTTAINLLTVLECKNYAAGSLPQMMGCPEMSPERQNGGRDTHKIGGCTIFKVR
jgi:hypothetical protein